MSSNNNFAKAQHPMSKQKAKSGESSFFHLIVAIVLIMRMPFVIKKKLVIPFLFVNICNSSSCNVQNICFLSKEVPLSIITTVYKTELIKSKAISDVPACKSLVCYTETAEHVQLL